VKFVGRQSTVCSIKKKKKKIKYKLADVDEINYEREVSIEREFSVAVWDPENLRPQLSNIPFAGF
jgi:hypothetical protein